MNLLLKSVWKFLTLVLMFAFATLINRTTVNPAGGSERATDHSLEAAIIVRRCAKDYGLDEESLVAVGLLVSSDDTEAPAAGMTPPQHDLVTTVQVTTRKDNQSQGGELGR